MYRVFLSWRYMRARRTNVIGIIGICVGVGALILILSIMSGFLAETRRTVRGSLADILITPSIVERFGGFTIPEDPAPLLAIVRAHPNVVAASAQLDWFGILTPDSNDRDRAEANQMLAAGADGPNGGVRLVGIDVADAFAATELRAALERETGPFGMRVADVDHPFAPPPEYEPTGRPLASVIIGEQQAAMLRIGRGSIVNILTGVPDLESNELHPSNRQYVVAGTFRSGENETDLEAVYFERSELRNLLGPPRGYSHILVKLDDYEKHGATVVADLRKQLHEGGFVSARGREVRTWEDFKGVLLGAIENEKVLMAIMLSLVVVVAGFTVFAILSMMVTEKRRDIGILSALGATPGGVHMLFLLIGFWDAVLGASLGAIIGTIGAIKIDGIERWLSNTFGVQIFNRDVYLFDHIPSVVDPVAIALIVLGAFVCTLLFASIPAWKAGRLHPLDALRYE